MANPQNPSSVLGEDSTSTHPSPIKSTSQSLHSRVTATDVIPPQRDVFLDWFHGTDAALATLTVNTANPGLWLDMREINPNARSIVIINGNASPDFAYTIYFSRDGLAADAYAVSTVAAGAKSQITQIVLDASTYGYDQYVKLEITPTVGQTGTQLTFQAYLTGRGG